MIWIEDNGFGIVFDVFVWLIIDFVIMCVEEGGNGMGMIFCMWIM